MNNHPTHPLRCLRNGFLLVLLAAWLAPATATAFTLTVQKKGGGALTGGFRWQVECDTTTRVVPGEVTVTNVSLTIHRSYAPVVTNGMSADGSPVVIPLPGDKRYYVSVLPNEGHAMSGIGVDLNQTQATVIVNPHPIPTAQISVFVFEDHNPINNNPDVIVSKAERGLSGFRIVVTEAAGQPSADAFGNPLGTTYGTNALGDYILDAEGAPEIETMGTGVLYTDVNGELLIKNLAPAKYGVQAIPPFGSCWVQTTTIEGKPTIDAWVKANEPTFFSEGFGVAFKHFFAGFVCPEALPWAINPPNALNATNVIKGVLRYIHFSRPPGTQGFFTGPPVPDGYVALNDISVGVAVRGLYATKCAPDGSFVISNVPPGLYQLVNWDVPLDVIIGFNLVQIFDPAAPILPGQPKPKIPKNGVYDLKNVLAFPWFGSYCGSVFYDVDQDGFRDPNEVGIPRQAINIRFRDGSVWSSTQTDDDGNFFLKEIFPFFKWLIAEVDFARYKATGRTAVIDDGGAIPPANGWTMPSFGVLNPQPQFDLDPASPNFGLPIINPNTGNNLSKTDVEPYPLLLDGLFLFAGQTVISHFGKANYDGDDNGGIAGIIYYGTTRAEDDPRFTAGEPWEPGIPRTQVNIYADEDEDKVIDDLDGDGIVTKADVDNYPFDWTEGIVPVKGPEDVDHNGNDMFDPGDALNFLHADSWDDAMPTGSQGQPIIIHGQLVFRGYDNFSTWNQVRTAFFDGGYQFQSIFPGGLANNTTNEVTPIPEGMYIVEVVPPPGYEVQKEEDKNVDFGDAFIPSKLLLAPELVGDLHLVPNELSLFPGVECAFAGQMRPLSDRKWVRVTAGRNSACDFSIWTYVPKAARVVGVCNNDVAAEFDPNNPIFGEKGTPSYIPISFQDWAGIEVARAYTDEFGGYNALLPSTFTINPPFPSGVSPNMLSVFCNHPTMPDPNNPGMRIMDPFYDPNYNTTANTLDFWPGKTTYGDTPVGPVGAFVGFPNRFLDAEPPTGTPVIQSLVGPNVGPLVCAPTDELLLRALGDTQVPNPEFSPTNGQPLLLQRDYGFGPSNAFCMVTVAGQMLNVLEWDNLFIRVTVPAGIPTGQLQVKRGDNGLMTKIGLTLSVGPCDASVRNVAPAPFPATPIQDAIDAANPGDLILIAPGTYNENPILYKPVKLQGSGAESTIINALAQPAERVTAWHNKILSLLGEDPFTINELPGILVLGNAGFPFTEADGPRIDGLGITASTIGGGITVNSHGRFLRMSNNKIKSNTGSQGGGITLGMASASTNSENDHIVISHNVISRNSGLAGGGILIFAHAHDYVITNNCIVGNYTRRNGAGIAHIGLSDRGLIGCNQILFNEAFNDQALIGGEGGGILVSGERLVGVISPGSGSVTIDKNLIQGNLGGSGDGGGIRAVAINGQDVLASPGNSNAWYELNILNNFIVNNVSGLAGGGLSLQEAVRVKLINNTIANNDSTATAREAFDAAATNSTPQPAGIVCYAHSEMVAKIVGQDFVNPIMEDNIIWHNRSYYEDGTLNGGFGGLLPNPDLFFWDLAVVGAFGLLNPKHSILTDTTGYDPSNIMLDPRFFSEYTNVLVLAITTDEGGNFINVRFEPLTPSGNYHIRPDSPAIGLGLGNFLALCPPLTLDIDKQTRPDDTFDAGADEYSLLPPPSGGGGPPPVGDVIGPSLMITSHVPGQFVPTATVNLAGIASDFMRGNNGVASVAVNGELANNGIAPGGGVAAWSKSVALAVGENIITVVARDNSPNANVSVATITLFFGVDPGNRPGSGPILKLALDEGAGTTTTNEGSAGGLFTRTTPTPAWSLNVPPLVGGARSVDFGTTIGNFGIDSAGPQPDMANLVRFTLTFWVNCRSVMQGGGGNFIFSSRGSGAGHGIEAVWRNDGSVDVGVNRNADGTARSLPGTLPVDAAAGSNNWRFVAIVYDSTLTSSNIMIFIGSNTNAAQLNVTRTYRLGPVGANLGIVTIGHRNPPSRAGNTSRMFRGLIDNVCLFGAALPASRVVGLQRGTTPVEPSPFPVVGYPEADTQYRDTDTMDMDMDGNATNDNVVLHMAAGDGFVKMADGKDLYIFGFSDVTGLAPEEVSSAMLKANFPAPTIVLKEGQKLFLKLSNVGFPMRPDLEDPHSVHYHGFPNAAPVFDGVPENSPTIRMGQTFTFFYNNVTPGTFIWHCHVEATEHIQMGMQGQLFVMPKQNRLANNASLRGFIHRTGFKYAYNDGDGSTYYDVEFPIQISGFDGNFHELHLGVQPLPFALLEDNYPLLNGRGYPDTVNTNDIVNLNGDPSQKHHSLITAKRGQKVLLRISSLSTVEFQTLTIAGIPMKVIGKGAALLRGPDPDGSGPAIGKNLYYETSSITLGGGEAFDVILDTSKVAAGTYFLYATRLHQLSNAEEDNGGMMTEIVITP